MLKPYETIENPDLWIIKHSPQHMKEIIGNNYAVGKIIKWLKNYHIYKQKHVNKKRRTEKNETASMIICGYHGTGKSSSVVAILKTLCYDIYELNLKKFKCGKALEKEMDHLLNIRVLTNEGHIRDNRKKAIIIDNYQTISIGTRKIINQLWKKNKKEYLFPMIFICNKDHTKSISDLKKNNMSVEFRYLDLPELIKAVKRISKKEGLQYESLDCITYLIENSQNDIRKLIMMLQNIYNLNETKQITLSMIISYCTEIKFKDINVDIFESTKQLFYNYQNINECLKIYDGEKTNMPLMVHENYMEPLILNCGQELLYDKINEIAELISIGNVLEKNIYNNQNWHLQDIHGILTCGIPSFHMDDGIDYFLQRNTEYPLDLNRTSIRNINKKNINNVKDYFPDFRIMDYLYLNNLMKKLVTENRYEECINLLKDYKVIPSANNNDTKMSARIIESLLKIDKINDDKFSLTPKQKREIEKLLK